MTSDLVAYPKTIKDLGQELSNYRSTLPRSAKSGVRIQTREGGVFVTVKRASGVRVSVDENTALFAGARPAKAAFEIRGFVIKTEALPEMTRLAFFPKSVGAIVSGGKSALSIRNQFSTLVRHFFETKVVSQLHEAALKDALKAPNELQTILNALERPEVSASVREQDPLAMARLRGIEARRRMLSEEGGMLTGERVGEILTMSRQAVDKRRKNGHLIGVPLGRRGYGYPAWQFSERGTLPHLETILDAMKQHDAWAKLAFFLSDNAALSGRRPIDVLRSGKAEEVLAAARTYGEHGAL